MLYQEHVSVYTEVAALFKAVIDVMQVLKSGKGIAGEMWETISGGTRLYLADRPMTPLSLYQATFKFVWKVWGSVPVILEMGALKLMKQARAGVYSLHLIVL